MGKDGSVLRRYGTFIWLIGCLLLLSANLSLRAEEPLQVRGYGVKLCEQYLLTYRGWEAGEEEQIVDYLRYSEWLSGLATGLSLAMNIDVMHGVEIKGALRRIQADCEEYPTKDFFNASMEFLGTLKTLR